jgi:hypothetical protein
MLRRLVPVAGGVVLAALWLSFTPPIDARATMQPTSEATTVSDVRSTFNRFCVSCHNDRSRTGGW